jgi:hypothetical protein
VVGGDAGVGRKRQKKDFNAEGTRGRKAGKKKIHLKRREWAPEEKRNPKAQSRVTVPY